MLQRLGNNRKWNPYFAGALAGILALSSVVVSTKLIGKPQYLGASTTFVRAAGLVEEKFNAEHVVNNQYFQEKKVKVDWQMMFLVGIFFGSLVSALTGRTFKFEKVPPIWKKCFGTKAVIRAVGAFIGGIIAIFGARLAGGCPSGHGLSGVMQLALSGLIAMVCFVIGGVIMARLLYRKEV